MGDRPIVQPHDRSCPAGPYTGGLQPSTVWVLVKDFELRTYPHGKYVELPNGLIALSFQNCNWYKWTYNYVDLSNPAILYGVTYSVYFSGINCVFEIFHSQLLYLVDCLTLSPIANEVSFPTRSRNVNWTNPTVVGYLQLSGPDLPPSWDSADLIGVPEQSPYYAEEFASNNYDRFQRFACHRDGTNIKIYGDF